MFDTHCHLNFKAFIERLDEVVDNARKAGISQIVIPGTDMPSSKRAVEIAEKYSGVYAAIGIHPHHVFENVKSDILDVKSEVRKIEELLKHKTVVAVGEVGLDRHYYNKTKYPDYQISENFMQLQKEFLSQQIGLAVKYKKSLIFHNREAKKDFLELLADHRSQITASRCVFHCCEPDLELLEFARSHKIFIGVDGDITYRKDKQEFIKNVPLEMLVLETDSPFLLPLQLRGNAKRRPSNEPKNIKLIANFIAGLLNISSAELEKITQKNSRELFQLD